MGILVPVLFLQWKNKWDTVQKATLQSAKHVQMQEISITISVALHSLKWSLHSRVLTAVYMEVGDLVFGCLGRFVLSHVCSPPPPFFFLWTIKSMIKDAKQRAEFSVSVNQQNSRVHTAKSIQPVSSWHSCNTVQVFNWEFSEQGWWYAIWLVCDVWYFSWPSYIYVLNLGILALWLLTCYVFTILGKSLNFSGPLPTYSGTL